MATIILNYDQMNLWEKFLEKYPIRHETIVNDNKRFILYYTDHYELMQIACSFGMFAAKNIYYAEI